MSLCIIGTPDSGPGAAFHPNAAAQSGVSPSPCRSITPRNKDARAKFRRDGSAGASGGAEKPYGSAAATSNQARAPRL